MISLINLCKLCMTCGDLTDEELDKELSKEDLGIDNDTMLKMLNFVDKFYKEDTDNEDLIEDEDVIEKDSIIKCNELTKLDGKKCGNFTLKIEDDLIKVMTHFKGSNKYETIYRSCIGITDTKVILDDLKSFGFNVELQEKEEEITYEDKEAGKLVGVIKHKNGKLVQAKLGKYKYINLAEMFKDTNKDIKIFNDKLKSLFPELEINS